jgi:hypothetical protein
MGPNPPPLPQPLSLFPVRPDAARRGVAAYGRAAALAEQDDTLRDQRDHYKTKWRTAEGRLALAQAEINDLREQIAALRTAA